MFYLFCGFLLLCSKHILYYLQRSTDTKTEILLYIYFCIRQDEFTRWRTSGIIAIPDFYRRRSLYHFPRDASKQPPNCFAVCKALHFIQSTQILSNVSFWPVTICSNIYITFHKQLNDVLFNQSGSFRA